MGLLGQIQNNPVFKKTQAMNAYQSLTTNPMQFLTNTPVSINAGNATQSVVAQVNFEFNQQNNIARIDAVGATPAHAISVTAIVTPTRVVQNGGVANPNRFDQLSWFTPGQGGAQLWVTDQQTGCTVLIVDWGTGQFDMVHLLPYSVNDFGTVSRFLMNLGKNRLSRFGNMLQGIGKRVAAPLQNHRLRNDADTVMDNSLSPVGWVPPQRYIMVQSQYALNRTNYTQVLGVVQHGTWEFFIQTKSPTATGQAVVNVRQANWRPWTDRFFHSY